MCTVSYVPYASGGFVLTSNRDETIMRTADHPGFHEEALYNVAFPRDPLSGGTWIAAAEGRAVCLLNGAFEAHRMKPCYRHSRGLVPLHFFEFSNADHFVREYDFEDLEPFTLIVPEASGVHEIRRDETTTFHHVYPANEPRIWASATLYDKSVIARRKAHLAEWLAEPEHRTVEGMAFFHQFDSGEDKINGNVIDRGMLKTVSITSIENLPGQYTVMRHHDLMDCSKSELKLPADLQQ